MLSERGEDVSASALIEMVIQAYYVLSYYKINSILHCLTDTRVWHYVLMEHSSTGGLVTKWYKSIKHTCISDVPQKEELASHVEFLITTCIDIFEQTKDIPFALFPDPHLARNICLTFAPFQHKQVRAWDATPVCSWRERSV